MNGNFLTALKFFAVVIFFCVNCSVCHAIIEGQDNHGTLEPSQLVLGYISVANTPADILNTYGQPDRMERYRWFYGKDFYIQFIGSDAMTVGEVTTTANNGIRTANGVAVGMSESILQRVYGTPQYQKRRDNETKYWYYGYGRHNWVYLEFSCTNGTIRKISLVWLD